MKKIFIYIFSLALLGACGTKPNYSIASLYGERIPVYSRDIPEPEMQLMVDYYKSQLDKEMEVIIGKSAEYMPFSRPESLLTNLTSDIMKELDIKYTRGKQIDLAVMNVNGHRANLPEGNITVRDMYEIYSFDNALTVVQLKGEQLTGLFEDYAKMGGAGISYNARLLISKDGKLLDAKLNGKPVEKDKIYTIVTLDYLADGNDGFETFKKALSVEATGIILRDYMLQYVQEMTAERKKITSVLDGRISIE